MKKITLLILILVSYFGFAQFPSPYCGPIVFTATTDPVEPITLVNFAGINNSTSALPGTNNGTTIIAHEDYTTITGNVTAGSSYTIILKGTTVYIKKVDGVQYIYPASSLNYNGEGKLAVAMENILPSQSGKIKLVGSFVNIDSFSLFKI